jgi:gliding motility-associated-like protein
MLHIPTAFSPDGDGINDVFLVRGNGIKEYRINIFNQWGVNVFSSSDIQEHWNGTSKGVKVQPGLYVYRIYFKDENNEVTETTGSIFIVK